VRIEGTAEPGVWIDAADIQLHTRLDTLPAAHPIAATIHNTLKMLMSPLPSSVSIVIRSTIPVASGMGSGAAVSVALIRALAAYADIALSDEDVSALAYQTEIIHHGTPSGIDNTVVTYVKPVFFLKGNPLTTIKVGQPFTIVIGDTGVAASTRESVRGVRAGWEADRAHYEGLFSAIGSIVRTARQSLEAGTPDHLGPLMDENHALLQEMGVSSPELDRLVVGARASGALGAKLSGGGRGGNMIALVPAGKATAVAKSLLVAGARNTITTEIA
jgi:mevalonate kinase